MTMLGEPLYYPHSALEIRDGTQERLKKAIVEVEGRVFNARTLPTKDDLLPCICVRHAGENGESLGDANVGEPKFISRLRLAISIVDRADSDLMLDASVTALIERCKRALFTDSRWLSLVEAVEAFSVTYQYPREEELTLCEARIELTVTYRSEWPPVAPNAFEEVETTFKLDATADPITIITDVPQ